ncbi:MAG TPA: menaquinone biosynthesis decarboxylase [Spirochaetia bacterium]|nr:menaquinone biosynthesis decarboxylase [Spirochaetia bacterium]
MAYRDLADFIKKLEEKGLLKRIAAEVDPYLEIAEISDRVVKSGGPALLFENVRGYDIPVLTNTFGSRDRMLLALERDSLDDLGEEVVSFIQPGDMPVGLLDKLRALPKLARLASYVPRTVRGGPCQEVVERNNPSLAGIPILTTWPGDAGPFVTLPLVFTKDPESGQRNVGMYRMQVFDSRTMGMHWHIHKDGARHYRKAAGKMPVAVAIGCDPATVFAATLPLPPDVDEMLAAGLIRREAVEMTRCVTSDLEVPAQAEIVLEGWVDPGEVRTEGPFGDHNGYYSPADEYPVFHLSCVTRRRRPVYMATVVGRPPMEDAFLGKATERLFLPLMRILLPEIVDVNMPFEGVFHNMVLVSIKKSYPGHARKVMYGLWGMGLMMLAKMIVVVDADVDVQNLSEVAWRVLGNIDARRDLVVAEGPVDALDHAAPLPHLGAKLGVDATRKWAAEGYAREWPEAIAMSPGVVELVDRKWSGYGL